MQQNDKQKQLSLKIVHLYPDEMNIYGDMGNIIALKQRCLWRGINVEVIKINQGRIMPAEAAGDLYFMGGGQDNDMYAVFDDLLAYKKKFLQAETAKGKVFLLICGAFQLFGEYFLDASGRDIQGLSILPVATKAPGDALADRCLGNLITRLAPEFLQEIAARYPGKMADTLVGFENHSGQTYFTSGEVKYLANTLYGKGNNAKEHIEGARIHNVFGSYTHGSLLPKNPHYADFLISLALEKKYQKKVELAPLDDSIEWQAHAAAVKKILGKDNSD